MINCFCVFCGIVDRRKAFNLISSRDHCQTPSPSQISDTPPAGFEPAQNLSSSLVECSCAVVITTTVGLPSHPFFYLGYVYCKFLVLDMVMHLKQIKSFEAKATTPFSNYSFYSLSWLSRIWQFLSLPLWMKIQNLEGRMKLCAVLRRKKIFISTRKEIVHIRTYVRTTINIQTLLRVHLFKTSTLYMIDFFLYLEVWTSYLSIY